MKVPQVSEGMSKRYAGQTFTKSGKNPVSRSKEEIKND